MQLVHLVLFLAGPVMAGDFPAPLTDADFPVYPAEQVALGKLLFADPILSGNRDIACITCHAPAFGTSDRVSLGLGAGAQGIGPQRTGQNRQRQSRNTPGLWSLGARQMRVFFHDGRVDSDPATGEIRTPVGGQLPGGLSGPLAVQTLFPLISPTEMAGAPGTNPVADAGSAAEAWAILAERLANSERLAVAFARAFREISRPELIEARHIGNALAAYIATAFRGTDTAFDRFLAGDTGALSDQARHGAELFYGGAGCSDCHSGPLLTDQGFHALGLPHFGPGRTARFDPIARDRGRVNVTDDPADAYRFRTPPLRGVALTAPYGHNGAYPTLEGIVRHHLDPVAGFFGWSPALATLPGAPRLAVADFAALEDQQERSRVVQAISLPARLASDAEIAALVAFLESLTPMTR